jgi:hypothetical protein
MQLVFSKAVFRLSVHLASFNSLTGSVRQVLFCFPLHK